MLKRAVCAVPVVFALSVAGPAIAQTAAQLPIAAVTCSDIVNASPAYQAALVYYAAGYRDGVDYAMTLTNSVASQAPAASAMASAQTSAIAPVASAPSAAASEPPSSASAPVSSNGSAIVGGLTLQADDVVKACAASPNALLTDIIANRGGGRGLVGANAAQPAANAAAPAAAPTSTTASGLSIAPATAPSAQGTTAISSDLQGASQQLQQNIASSAPAPASLVPVPAPAPAASSP